MKRRFIIAADKLDSDQESAFREFLAEKGTWWHWIENVWLFTTDDENISAAEIRDFLSAFKAPGREMVFEIAEELSWATSGRRNKAGKKMTDWIRKYWAQD